MGKYTALAIGWIILFTTFPSQALLEETLPFWRSKKRIYKQISDQRKVVVAVKREVDDKDKETFRLVGAGSVHAPMGFCVEKVSDFEQLKSISGHFKKVVHKRPTREIYMVLEAFNYQARMLLEYKWQKKKGNRQQMDWRVVWGPFKGMVGHFQFEKVSETHTDVSIWAKFSSHNIPMPGFFLRFTLEVIAEKVAKKMRSYLEDQYKKENKPKPDKGNKP